MIWQHILRGIAIFCVVFLCILFLPIFLPLSEGLSTLAIELKLPLPSLFFLIIFSLLFAGIGFLTAIKNVGWILFILFLQQIYFIGVVFELIIDSFFLGFIIALLCIIFLECSSRLSTISAMAEVIPIYQENTDRISNYINKVKTRFPNVEDKLNAGRRSYKLSPTLDHLAITFFAITLSTFVFYLISTFQIVGRRHPYLIVGMLLPIVILAISLQKIKKEEPGVKKPIYEVSASGE